MSEMSKEKKSDVNVSSEAASDDSYDAHQVAEAIEEGDLNAPSVDVASDYEASKEYSVSKHPENQEVTPSLGSIPSDLDTAGSQNQSTGNPDDFRSMAKQVTPDLEEMNQDENSAQTVKQENKATR